MGGVKLLGVEVVVDCVCPIPWRVVSSCADVAWIVGVLSSSSSKMVSKSQYSPFLSPVGDVWRRLDLGYSQGPSQISSFRGGQIKSCVPVDRDSRAFTEPPFVGQDDCGWASPLQRCPAPTCS